MSIEMKATTLATVIAVIDDLTQDWGVERNAPPGAATLLAGDLEFTSVDIIQLCVALEECYSRRFGFQDLLMKDGSYVGDLALGRLSEFIDTKLTQPGTQP
jgi:acyl carrier protein